MNKVTFTSVEIVHIKRTPSKAELRIEFPLTKSASSDMEWGELQDFEDSANLRGDLSASLIQLLPDDKQLRKNGVDLDVSRVHKFVATRQQIEGKRGKGTCWRVQADIVVTDITGMGKLEAYMLTAGKSEMRVSYEKAAVQPDLPGALDDSQGKLAVQ
jgi:hypothetical protein